MRRGSPADPRLLAYHEAGHAVAAWALKLPPRPVSLLPAEDGAPPEPPAMAGEPLDPAAAEREAEALLAGVEAEALLTGDYDWWGAEADRERAEALLARMLAAGYRAAPRDGAEAELVGALDGDPDEEADGEGDETRRAWALLLHRTRALVRQEPVRAAIAALAAALQAQGRIEPQQALRVIRQGIAEADPELM